MNNKLPMPLELIERRIYVVRGQKVMFDFDLAELYQVPTKTLNQAVKRNINRFPKDFMFELTEGESSLLRSQIVTLEKGRGRYSKYKPKVFTELGVAMLSSVLNSEWAIEMNVVIMRAFVKLRQLVATHKELAEKIEKLEHGQKEQGFVLALMASDIKGLGKKL